MKEGRSLGQIVLTSARRDRLSQKWLGRVEQSPWLTVSLRMVGKILWAELKGRNLVTGRAVERLDPEGAVLLTVPARPW